MPVGVPFALFGNLNFPVALQYFGDLLIGESLARLNLEAKHVGKASGVSYSGTSICNFGTLLCSFVLIIII